MIGPPIVVVDSSALLAWLVGEPALGERTTAALRGARLVAPSLLPFEVGNVLRRHEAAGLIDATTARLAHEDLVDLPVELWPYVIVAARVWQLRANLTAYDASYVALAEMLDASLVTVDRRLTKASGPRCRFVVPTVDVG